MGMWCILLVSSALAQSATPPAVPPAKPPAVESPNIPKSGPLEQQKASLDKQKEAIRKQAEQVGAWMSPWSPLSVTPDCEPLADTVVAPLIEEAAKTQKLEPALIRAVIEQESALKPCAISKKGAQGLMQIMPGTAEQLGVKDVFDPKQNIDGGAQFLKQLIDKYGGDVAKALGAYNAGPTKVDQADAIPAIPETQDYVDAIMKKLDATRTAPPNIPKPKPIGN